MYQRGHEKLTSGIIHTFFSLKEGSIYCRGSDFSISKNCLKLEDESEDTWMPMVCTNEAMLQPAIPIISKIIKYFE